MPHGEYHTANNNDIQRKDSIGELDSIQQQDFHGCANNYDSKYGGTNYHT